MVDNIDEVRLLEEILRLNPVLMSILEVLEKDEIANYYVAAGCINQTVFNYFCGYPIDYGIKDYDIVYFDSDLSYEAEDIVIKRLSRKLAGIDAVVDIKNQARVYLWYYEKYGIKRKPYISVEDAISCWGATVTCVGVRLEKGKFVVWAPYGLSDMFNLVIRPVKKGFTKDDYDKKALNWLEKWPKLKKIEW